MVQRKGERLQRLLPYRRLQFTFPYHDGMPSHFSQPVQHLMVPLPIPPDLLHPESGVRFRHHIIFAPLMSVPEAPVHQNTGAILPQHDIRLARQPRMIEPIPESPTPQKFPDKNLRLVSLPLIAAILLWRCSMVKRSDIFNLSSTSALTLQHRSRRYVQNLA